MSTGAIIWWCGGFPILLIIIVCIIIGVHSHNKRIREEQITEGSVNFNPEMYNIKVWSEYYQEDYGDLETNKDIKYLQKNLPQVLDILDNQFKRKLRYAWMQKSGEELFRGARKSQNIDLIVEALQWRRRLSNYLVKVYNKLNQFPDLYILEDYKDTDILDAIKEYYDQLIEDHNKLWKIGRNIEKNAQRNFQNNELNKAYKTLGLSPSSTFEQVKAARLKLMMKYHPDHNKSPDAAKKFIAIQNAFELIAKKNK